MSSHPSACVEAKTLICCDGSREKTPFMDWIIAASDSLGTVPRRRPALG
jgi:hypothetical protein